MGTSSPGLSFATPLVISTLLLQPGGFAEAPPGAVPSLGSVAWFADYELRLRPEDSGASPLPWRLPAWRFQQDVLDFYHDGGNPPLNTAFFVAATLPDGSQRQVLSECPGLLLAATLLVAQVRLSAGDVQEATWFFQRAAAMLAEAVELAPTLQQKVDNIGELAQRLQPWAGGSWTAQKAEVDGFRVAVSEAARLVAPGWGLEDAVASFFQAPVGQSSGAMPAAAASGCSDSRLDVVVAFCKEDLSWLAGLADARIWIYAKCDPHPDLASLGLADLPCASLEELPNLAMESLAYATHLERRYGNFGDYTLFLQGRPNEHAPRRLVDDAVGAIRVDVYNVPFLHLNARRFLAGSSFCLRDLYQRLFDALPGEEPEVFGSYCCSQFLVRRDRLMARSRELYARIAGLLLGEMPLACVQDVQYDPRPRIAVSALFEHLWHVVLGEAPLLPPRQSDKRLPLFARVDVTPGELPDYFDSSRDPGEH